MPSQHTRYRSDHQHLFNVSVCCQRVVPSWSLVDRCIMKLLCSSMLTFVRALAAAGAGAIVVSVVSQV